MTGTTSDISELLELIETSENLFRFNSEIENEIARHGGKVVYSYNDLIIATEISDEAYGELKKNPLIDFMYDMPLKRYGDIDTNLINQLDISKLNVSAGSSKEEGTSGTGYSGTSGILPGPEPTPAPSGGTSGTVSKLPSILGTLTLTALTNEWFEYKVLTSGPSIRLAIQPNIYGQIGISGDTIKGLSSRDGNFDIVITATNDYGVDTKTLVVTIGSKPVITSLPITTYCSINKSLLFEIKASGALPINYVLSGLTIPGLSLTSSSGQYFVSGVPTVKTGCTYTLYAINSYGSDKKTFTIQVGGDAPLITSSSSTEGLVNEDYWYIITATGDPTITYKIEGSLPPGLTFENNQISGVPNENGHWNVKLIATNPYGENKKNLSIKIVDIHP